MVSTTSDTTSNTILKDLGVPEDLGPYNSLKELYEASKTFAIQHGYVITHAGNADKDQIHLKCDYGGTYCNRMGPAHSNDSSNGQGLRPNTSSWLIGCLFYINGKSVSP